MSKNQVKLTNQRVFQILVYRSEHYFVGLPTCVFSLPLAALFIFSRAVFALRPTELTEGVEEAITVLITMQDLTKILH